MLVSNELDGIHFKVQETSNLIGDLFAGATKYHPCILEIAGFNATSMSSHSSLETIDSQKQF